jgi:hypothetical protein
MTPTLTLSLTLHLHRSNLLPSLIQPLLLLLDNLPHLWRWHNRLVRILVRGVKLGYLVPASVVLPRQWLLLLVLLGLWRWLLLRLGLRLLGALLLMLILLMLGLLPLMLLVLVLSVLVHLRSWRLLLLGLRLLGALLLLLLHIRGLLPLLDSVHHHHVRWHLSSRRGKLGRGGRLAGLKLGGKDQ